MNAVIDNGINFIDTANDYGRSEEYIGRFRRTAAMSSYWPPSAAARWCAATRAPTTLRMWTKENLFSGLHESLARMRTDYVDPMQLHNPSVEQRENGDLVTALQEMKEQGKGALDRYLSHAPAPGDICRLGVFDCFQIPYSALERQHEEVIQAASDRGGGRHCSRRRRPRRTRRRLGQERPLGELGGSPPGRPAG